jgi:hypothetical protein
VLVFGLIGIAQWQSESRINDIAEVDAALLTDDVPPDAYADSGFMAFLKNGPLSDSEDLNSRAITKQGSLDMMVHRMKLIQKFTSNALMAAMLVLLALFGTSVYGQNTSSPHGKKCCNTGKNT